MDVPPPVSKVVELPNRPVRDRPDQHKVRWILGASLFWGILGDVLLRTGRPGINVTLVCVVLCLLLSWGWRRYRESAPCQYLLMVLCLLGLCVAWRDSGVLVALNSVAIVAILLVLSLRPTVLQSNAESLFSLGANILRGAGRALSAPLVLLFRDTDWTQMEIAPPRHGSQVLRGLLLTLPLLLVFTCLFGQADAVFSAKMELLGERLGDMVQNADRWLVHGFYSLVFALVAATILHPSVLGKKWTSSEPTSSWHGGVGEIELVMVLGSLLGLFTLFVLIQFRYLFGGHELVQTVAGLTYASYARKGFFALVTAVFILHVLLVTGGCLLSQAEQRVQSLFAWLSLGLVFAVTFVFASAFYRLYLYMESYGLTRSRFYAAVILLWLAVAFALLTVKLIRPRWRFFSGVYFQSLLVTALILNVVNPDGMIARVNLTRAMRDGKLDRDYLEQLSTDAIPAILRHGHSISPENMAQTAEVILDRRLPEGTDWRHWNLSRARAVGLQRHTGKMSSHGADESGRP